ncbi:MAG: hypothetical protein V7K89_11640 [Nostoc sp.]|uniref:hypothetical protein n=1 Tax=Nostoc sp. TaxID=1180 RepID=UPI002FFB3ED9
MATLAIQFYSKELRGMSASVLPISKFCKGEIVSFLGGEGVIKNYRFESGSWEYLVEMPMGPEPEMGRVGYETTIWLPEVDISSLVNHFSGKLLNLEQKNLAKAC